MTNINITINGEETVIDEAINVNQLIEQLDMQQKKFAIDINGMIIPRSEYETYQVKQHDTIEIVVAVGGG